MENNDSNYWVNLGYDLEQNGNFYQAKKYYEKALSLDSNNYAALINLSTILQKMGKFDDALKFLLR